ncbi:MAG TPA: phage minor capsid protein, partial [Saprospiraceae bacterium]|nr:phage minor capsid protein [Saprospiraceae bacterium]
MQIVDEFYTENDNKYVNISFTNSLSNTNQSIPLEYNVTKTSAILDNASEYYVTVEKFDIPLQSLPLCIMPIIANQADPNLSPILIGIRNGGVDTLRNVVYVSQNSFSPPSQLGSLSQVITPYYFIYSYVHMVQMINTALAAAFVASGVAGTAPYFIYTASTGLFSLIVPASFNVAIGPQIVFNFRLFQFFDCFDTIDDFYSIPGGLFVFKVFGLVNESFGYAQFGVAPTNPPAFYKITQDCQN